MKVIEISQFGPADVLKVGERPQPVPQNGEVLIKVHAAGVNRPDILQRLGRYPPPPGVSDIPGLEVAGNIIESKSEQWQEGDQVCALQEHFVSLFFVFALQGRARVAWGGARSPRTRRTERNHR